MPTIAASFAVGFSDQSWQHAGPYYGEGATYDLACLDASSKCAMEFEERETEFMTFLGRPVVVERSNAMDGTDVAFIQQTEKRRGIIHVGSSHRSCAARRS